MSIFPTKLHVFYIDGRRRPFGEPPRARETPGGTPHGIHKIPGQKLFFGGEGGVSPQIFPFTSLTSRFQFMPAHSPADPPAGAPSDPPSDPPSGSPAELGIARRSRADRARQIADVLRRQVASGVFGDGLLPGETDLASEFGASRNAVRDALAILGAEGVVTRVQGTGTVAVGPKVQHSLHRLTGLAETLREHGEIVNEVRAAALVTAPPAVAERLRPDGGEPPQTVVYVERLRRLNGLPLSLDLTYLAPDIGEPLLAEDLAHHDIFALIESRAGSRLGDASITIEALSADPHTAAVLEAPPGAALLMVERLTRLADGRPVDLEYIRLRGDRLALRGELTRDSQ
jgi:GntR family transcriptional regulator